MDRFPQRSKLCYDCKARKSTLLRTVKSHRHITIWYEVSHNIDLMRSMLEAYASNPGDFRITDFVLAYVETYPQKRQSYSRALQLIAEISEVSHSAGSSSSGGGSSSSSDSQSGGAPPPPPPPPQPLPAIPSDGSGDISSDSSENFTELVDFRIQGSIARRVRRRRC